MATCRLQSNRWKRPKRNVVEYLSKQWGVWCYSILLWIVIRALRCLCHFASTSKWMGSKVAPLPPVGFRVCRLQQSHWVFQSWSLITRMCCLPNSMLDHRSMQGSWSHIFRSVITNRQRIKQPNYIALPLIQINYTFKNSRYDDYWVIETNVSFCSAVSDRYPFVTLLTGDLIMSFCRSDRFQTTTPVLFL